MSKAMKFGRIWREESKIHRRHIEVLFVSWESYTFIFTHFAVQGKANGNCLVHRSGFVNPDRAGAENAPSREVQC